MDGIAEGTSFEMVETGAGEGNGSSAWKERKMYCCGCYFMLMTQWARKKQNLIAIIFYFLCRKIHCKVLQLLPDHPAPQ